MALSNLFAQYFFVGGVKYEKLIELVDNPNSFGSLTSGQHFQLK
jgi:hypothetical protein